MHAKIFIECGRHYQWACHYSRQSQHRKDHGCCIHPSHWQGNICPTAASLRRCPRNVDMVASIRDTINAERDEKLAKTGWTNMRWNDMTYLCITSTKQSFIFSSELSSPVKADNGSLMSLCFLFSFQYIDLNKPPWTSSRRSQTFPSNEWGKRKKEQTEKLRLFF